MSKIFRNEDFGYTKITVERPLRSAGIVEQVSLDLQNEFPLAKGFSARNLWSMKKWYSFYSGASESEYLLQNLTEQLDFGSIKLNQIGAEMRFPTVFGFVPWRHHVEIVNKRKTVEEALFYIILLVLL